jgi:hypothetical protein
MLKPILRLMEHTRIAAKHRDCLGRVHLAEVIIYYKHLGRWAGLVPQREQYIAEVSSFAKRRYNHTDSFKGVHAAAM